MVALIERRVYEATMLNPSLRSNVDNTAKRLRKRVLALREGAFLGSEDALERDLGVSRPTIRQAARVLEREGLLRVRRGNNGGYFGARPDAGFIEATVASYLEVLDARPEDLTRVATALWVETVRQAAKLGPEEAGGVAQRFRPKIKRLSDAASFSQVQKLEQDVRQEVFKLVGSPYVELIFNINANFAHRRFDSSPSTRDDTELHRRFVTAWKQASLLLMDAIASADVELAVLAAKRTRDMIHHRIWPQATPALK